MKDLLGKFISLKYRDRKDIISGFLIDFNDDWTLLKYNPVDYILDGFRLLKTKNILKYKRDDYELFRENVLTANGLLPYDSDKISISNVFETLQTISDKYGAFEIELKDSTICYIGRLIKISKGHITIQEIDPKAKWVETEKFKIESIRIFEFDTDYIRSLITYSRYLENNK